MRGPNTARPTIDRHGYDAGTKQDAETAPEAYDGTTTELLSRSASIFLRAFSQRGVRSKW